MRQGTSCGDRYKNWDLQRGRTVGERLTNESQRVGGERTEEEGKEPTKGERLGIDGGKITISKLL